VTYLWALDKFVCPGDETSVNVHDEVVYHHEEKIVVVVVMFESSPLR
jgi:hypothetical protein